MRWKSENWLSINRYKSTDTLLIWRRHIGETNSIASYRSIASESRAHRKQPRHHHVQYYIPLQSHPHPPPPCPVHAVSTMARRVPPYLSSHVVRWIGLRRSSPPKLLLQDLIASSTRQVRYKNCPAVCLLCHHYYRSLTTFHPSHTPNNLHPFTTASALTSTPPVVTIMSSHSAACCKYVICLYLITSQTSLSYWSPS